MNTFKLGDMVRYTQAYRQKFPNLTADVIGTVTHIDERNGMVSSLTISKDGKPVTSILADNVELHVPKIVMSYHDDWVVNVLLSDGRVYSFVTEMWPEHGDGSDRNWRRVVRVAERIALDYAMRNLETWRVAKMPATEPEFHAEMDAVCQRTNDADFRRYMRNA
jgi:hypothetical protein